MLGPLFHSGILLRVTDKVSEYTLHIPFSHIYKHFQRNCQGASWEMESSLKKMALEQLDLSMEKE